MEDEDAELIALFVQEAVEHLETVEPDLLEMEESGEDTDAETVNRLFRSVHSIKGSAGFFGLTKISKLSHVMENLLGKVREKTIKADADVTASLLTGLDKLKTMIDDVSASDNVDATEEMRVISAIIDANDPNASPPAEEKAAEEPAPQPAEADATPEPAAVEPPAAEEKAEETAKAEEPAKAVEPTKAEEPAKAVEPTKAVEEAAPESSLPVPTAPANANKNATIDLFLYPQEVKMAVKHGHRFLLIVLDLKGEPAAKKVAFDQIKQQVVTVGNIVATEPADPSLAASFTQDKSSILLTTVLEKDLFLSLVELPEDSVKLMPIPESMVSENTPGGTEVASSVEEKTGPRLLKPEKIDKAGSGKKSATGSTKTSKPVLEETLRVSVTLLDELINMAGELVLTRNQLTRAVDASESLSPQVQPLIQNLDSVTSRMQEKVMQARMQQVSSVFNKFPRIVRDLAKKLDKKIDLSLRGGDVELDKSMIEHLSDPLTHMIRNVADHAIESPKDRIADGKPESGQVELAAYHEEGMINIALTDDGAGIDQMIIMQKAIEKGIITERESENMGKEEILALIFTPGFSMAKQVSDVSGRGVGMDVVRTNIEKMRGTVHISSDVGKGTSVVLKLPLTLAIIPSMTIMVAGQRFSIPEIGLVEVVHIVGSELSERIQMVGNAPVLRLRNILLPLMDLSEVLDIPYDEEVQGPHWISQLSADDKKSKDSSDEENLEEIDEQVVRIVVINVGGNEFGMVVDEILDREEIVVKPLPAVLKDNPRFSATTILGDGSVALIIDYAGIMEKANINFGNVEQALRDNLENDRSAALKEMQNIILLETGNGLFMGIVNNMVRRVGKFKKDSIEIINGQPYVHYGDITYRIVFPEHLIDMPTDKKIEISKKKIANSESDEADESDDKDLYMLIPNMPDVQVGLVFSRIVDSLTISIDLDLDTVLMKGLFGSSWIQDRVVLFPDIQALFEMAGVPVAQTSPAIDCKGLKALVVDDTPFLQLLTSSFLSQEGFEVSLAGDGRQAMTQLGKEQFDLLVTDINMPIMDGFELVREVSSTKNSAIPVIATSSSTSEDLEIRCSQAGIVGCVPAMDKDSLIKTLATLQRT
ncbi:MAG: response regulator [Magnetococcales bacterium]|nr:response regulator [Magnetococcales bacterium]